jgi:hypothetical protein
MNAGAWNTNVHKQAIVKPSEEKAPNDPAKQTFVSFLPHD